MINQLDEDQLVVFMTTEADTVKANKLAQELLNKRLAVCVSACEVNSSYWWNECLQSNNEIQLTIKTKISLAEKLSTAILELHSYETPELLKWNVSANNDYLKWVNSCCSN